MNDFHIFVAVVMQLEFF